MRRGWSGDALVRRTDQPGQSLEEGLRVGMHAASPPRRRRRGRGRATTTASGLPVRADARRRRFGPGSRWPSSWCAARRVLDAGLGHLGRAAITDEAHPGLPRHGARGRAAAEASGLGMRRRLASPSTSRRPGSRRKRTALRGWRRSVPFFLRAATSPAASVDQRQRHRHLGSRRRHRLHRRAGGRRPGRYCHAEPGGGIGSSPDWRLDAPLSRIAVLDDAQVLRGPRCGRQRLDAADRRRSWSNTLARSLLYARRRRRRRGLHGSCTSATARPSPQRRVAGLGGRPSPASASPSCRWRGRPAAPTRRLIPIPPQRIVFDAENSGAALLLGEGKLPNEAAVGRGALGGAGRPDRGRGDRRCPRSAGRPPLDCLATAIHTSGSTAVDVWR